MIDVDKVSIEVDMMVLAQYLLDRAVLSLITSLPLSSGWLVWPIAPRHFKPATLGSYV